MKSALLVIDVQRILTEGRHAAYAVEGVLARKARAAAAPVIFVQHETKGDEMRHGTPPWQLSPALEVQPGDHHVRRPPPTRSTARRCKRCSTTWASPAW